MNFRFPFIILTILFLLCCTSTYLLSNQREDLIKMKNGNTLSVGLNKTAVIKNIWKDESLKSWSIKIKVLAIEKETARLEIASSTFLGKDFCEAKLMKIDESISIIQAEEVTTEIRLVKLVANKVNLSLRIFSAPPAPSLSEKFNVELQD